MPRRKAPATVSSRTLHLQVLILASFLLGGGGVAYGFRNLIVQLLALVLLALHGRSVWVFLRHGPRYLVALVAVSMAVPLLQLVPLPPTIWQALSGRQLVTESLQLVSTDSSALPWYPLSVDSARTLLAFIGTLVPFTVIALGWDLPRADIERLLRTFVILALASVLLGVFQVAPGGDTFVLFEESRGKQLLFGTFANRNSESVMLVMAAVMALSVSWRNRAVPASFVLAFTLLFLFVGAIATGSRTGTALLVPAVAFMALWFASAQFAALKRARLEGRVRAANRIRSRGVLVFAVSIVAVLGIIGLGLTGGRLHKTFERFGKMDDQRAMIWPDALDSAARFWPVGAGVGTFDEVFQLDESLEHLSPKRAGRAHNDFIETAVGSGVLGLGDHRSLAALAGCCRLVGTAP